MSRIKKSHWALLSAVLGLGLCVGYSNYDAVYNQAVKLSCPPQCTLTYDVENSPVWQADECFCVLRSGLSDGVIPLDEAYAGNR